MCATKLNGPQESLSACFSRCSAVQSVCGALNDDYSEGNIACYKYHPVFSTQKCNLAVKFLMKVIVTLIQNRIITSLSWEDEAGPKMSTTMKKRKNNHHHDLSWWNECISPSRFFPEMRGLRIQVCILLYSQVCERGTVAMLPEDEVPGMGKVSVILWSFFLLGHCKKQDQWW